VLTLRRFSFQSYWSAALLPLLFLLVACPKQQPPENVVPKEQPPSLGITDLEPSSTTEGTPVTVTAEGFGFVQGSNVYIGTREARGVDVYSDTELTFRAAEDLEAGSYDIRVVSPSGDQAVSSSSFVVNPSRQENSDCQLVTVFFEFSESQLSDSTRGALSNNAECIETQKFESIRLAGHADERGSTVFNLSLGEERAEAVRNYLVDLGASRDVFSIVSYGEEQPLRSGMGEENWAQNRRVEFIVQ